MYVILFVDIFYVTDIPTSDDGSLWDFLTQLQEQFHIHITMH